MNRLAHRQTQHCVAALNRQTPCPTKRNVFYSCTPSAELYGADRTLLDLVSGLDASLWEAHVALAGAGPLVEELQAVGAQVHIGPLGVAAMGSLKPAGLLSLAVEMPRSFRFVRKLMRELQPEIVHTNTMIVLGGAIAASRGPARHLWHIHEIPIRPTWLAPLAARLFARWSDQVVCNSHATAHTFMRHHPDLWRKLTVVHNGIDPERLSPLPDSASARQRLGWPEEVPIALVLGRINAWKGQGLALEAFRLLANKQPDLRLAIVGGTADGAEHWQEALNREIEASGLSDRVLRHPFDAQVSEFFSACDLLIVPSTRPEPFGLVLLEAFAAGKPVLAAGHGGPLEIVQAGHSGECFEPSNPHALARALQSLVQNRKGLAMMGARAKRRGQEEFSLDAYRQGFEEVYSEPKARAYQGSTPQIIHVVLGKANPERMNGVNRMVHGLADNQAQAVLWGLCHEPDAPTPPRSYELLTFSPAPAPLEARARIARTPASPCGIAPRVPPRIPFARGLLARDGQHGKGAAQARSALRVHQPWRLCGGRHAKEPLGQSCVQEKLWTLAWCAAPAPCKPCRPPRKTRCKPSSPGPKSPASRRVKNWLRTPRWPVPTGARSCALAAWVAWMHTPKASIACWNPSGNSGPRAARYT